MPVSLNIEDSDTGESCRAVRALGLASVRFGTPASADFADMLVQDKATNTN